MHIAVISGSPRPKRQSHKVAVEVFQRLQARAGLTLSLLDVLEANLPPLDEVYRSKAEPSETLKAWSESLKAADGILIVSPEHNGSYPGALKNALDYFLPEYAFKAFGFVLVSAGVLGGISAARNLHQYVQPLKGIALPSFVITPQVQKIFDEQGQLQDQGYGSRLETLISELLWLSEALARQRAEKPL